MDKTAPPMLVAVVPDAQPPHPLPPWFEYVQHSDASGQAWGGPAMELPGGARSGVSMPLPIAADDWTEMLEELASRDGSGPQLLQWLADNDL